MTALLIAARQYTMLDQQYIYFPSPWDDRDWAALSGLPLEEVWLTAADGTRIFGWFLEAPNQRAVLLWCHGNAGNLTHRLENMAELHRRGLSHLIFDYRGYGQSGGVPSEDGFYADGLAAYDYLTGQRGIRPEQLVVFGRSLGAAVAVAIANQRTAAGLILETPFPSVEAVARTVFGGLPAHLLLKARFDLMKRLPSVRMPTLVLHGDRDTIIPYELGQKVFEAAPEPKAFYRIPGADHNDTFVVGGEPYFQALLDFIARVVPDRTPEG